MVGTHTIIAAKSGEVRRTKGKCVVQANIVNHMVDQTHVL